MATEGDGNRDDQISAGFGGKLLSVVAKLSESS